MVSLVTMYHRRFKVTNDICVVHRYLPRSVGRLVVYYMWLALPFVEHLSAIWRRQGADDWVPVPDSFPEMSPYVWGPDAGTGRAWSPVDARKLPACRALSMKDYGFVCSNQMDGQSNSVPSCDGRFDQSRSCPNKWLR